MMAFASLYIGDSQTMAAEAGVLGDVGQKIGQNVQIDCKLLNLSGFLVVCSGHSVIKFYLSSELF